MRKKQYNSVCSAIVLHIRNEDGRENASTSYRVAGIGVGGGLAGTARATGRDGGASLSTCNHGQLDVTFALDHESWFCHMENARRKTCGKITTHCRADAAVIHGINMVVGSGTASEQSRHARARARARAGAMRDLLTSRACRSSAGSAPQGKMSEMAAAQCRGSMGTACARNHG